MTENRLVKEIIDGIQDKKGSDIAIIDLRGIEGAIAAYFVICTGNSPMQVDAIAGSIYDKVHDNLREKPAHVNGLENAMWVAMDYTDVMVHVFLPDMRDYYALEDLWKDCPTELVPNLD